MQTTPLTTLKYSAFLGGMYPSDPATEAKIAEGKTAVGGETVVKRGFTGYDGDGPTAKAIRLLAEAGIKSVKMSGPICAVRLVDKTVNGMPTKYLTVTTGTVEGKTFLSIDAGSLVAQHLIRLLTDATPGVPTEISFFAKYAKREGATRYFADHFAMVKQNGQSLKGVNPADMWPLIRKKQDALKAAGIDDPQILEAAKKKAKVEWHLALFPAISARFASYYDALQAEGATAALPAPAAAATEVATASAPATTAADDDYADPFGLNEIEEPVAPPVIPAAYPAPPTPPVAVVAKPRISDPFTL